MSQSDNQSLTHASFFRVRRATAWVILRLKNHRQAFGRAARRLLVAASPENNDEIPSLKTGGSLFFEFGWFYLQKSLFFANRCVDEIVYIAFGYLYRPLALVSTFLSRIENLPLGPSSAFCTVPSPTLLASWNLHGLFLVYVLVPPPLLPLLLPFALPTLR